MDGRRESKEMHTKLGITLQQLPDTLHPGDMFAIIHSGMCIMNSFLRIMGKRVPGIQNRVMGIAGAGITCIAFLLLGAGCSCREVSQAPVSEPTAEQPSVAPMPSVPEVLARMKVVSLSGQPLSGMMPIATLQPNAFDEPIAVGPLTDLNGESRLRFPDNQKVALRAWDPELRFFPNNFYDALPNTGSVTDTLVITMVESAHLEAVLITPQGRHVEHENAGIMLFHPIHGPWWPAEAEVGEKGAVTFRNIPPGKFVMRLKVTSGPTVELPETYIAPGEITHLGMVYLQ